MVNPWREKLAAFSRRDVAVHPGEFEGDPKQYLRHLDGGICVIAETGLEPSDAATCVKGGADVLVNPGDYPWVVDDQRFSGEVQHWLRNAQARHLSEHVPMQGVGVSPMHLDLYKGLDGEVVLHLTGSVRWGEDLETYREDGTMRLPAGALELKRSSYRGMPYFSSSPVLLVIALRRRKGGIAPHRPRSGR